ncbi:MAG: tRNA pseudouridine(55) synthase TruB [Candidatus Hinthialibacter antarcticus]|nr:tRNA pseudouridine(55) synthase TruB [Candidatus Hinthialibacter antarcticus]
MKLNKNTTIVGVLNVNKPSGMTSHDVVDRIRRAAKIKQVGHTGTLDPMATGVLPICVGRATKIQQFLIAQDKEYDVKMELGLITDSQDRTGEVIEERPMPDLSRENVEKTLLQFTGEIMQTPPMISAKHHKGKRLYELARQGVEVKRDPCKITIHKLELTDIQPPYVHFLVTCSKGTYIRTLCHDIGEAMNSGAVMAGLSRVRCGRFHIDQSVDLADLRTPDDVAAKLFDLNQALDSMPSVMVGTEGKTSMFCGRSLAGGAITRRIGDFTSGAFIRVTSRDGALIGVGEALMASDQLDSLAGNLRVIKPVKVFHTA